MAIKNIVAFVLLCVAMAFVPTATFAEGEKRVTFSSFPSSAKPAIGKWIYMGRYKYDGLLTKACNLLRLSVGQCISLQKQRSEGVCTEMEVPNGVVLDGLTFTKGGQHYVQEHVLVALKDPPTRLTEVCDLGDGVYVLFFHGCENYGVVRTPAPVEVRGPLSPVPVDESTESEGPCSGWYPFPEGPSQEDGTYVVFLHLKDKDAVDKCLLTDSGSKVAETCDDCITWLHGQRGVVKGPAVDMRDGWAYRVFKNVAGIRAPRGTILAYCNQDWEDEDRYSEPLLAAAK